MATWMLRDAANQFREQHQSRGLGNAYFTGTCCSETVICEDGLSLKGHSQQTTLGCLSLWAWDQVVYELLHHWEKWARSPPTPKGKSTFPPTAPHKLVGYHCRSLYSTDVGAKACSSNMAQLQGITVFRETIPYWS